MRPFAALLLSLLGTGVLNAQSLPGRPPGNAEVRSLYPLSVLPDVSASSAKTKGGAWLRVLLHTVVPAGLGAATVDETNAIAIPALTYGLLVGPSMGSFYAKDNKTAVTGILIRGTGGILIGVGLAELSEFMSSVSPEAIFGFGGVLWLVGTTYSFATLSGSVRRYNEAHPVSLIPLYDPKNRTAMVRLTVNF